MSTYIEALGWALLHSLWLGAICWLALEAALAWPGVKSPRVRGRLAGAALAVFVVAVAVAYGGAVERGAEARAERSAEAKRAVGPVMVGGTAEPAATGTRNGTDVTKGTDRTYVLHVEAEAGVVAAAEPIGWRERLRPVLPWLVGLWAAGVVIGLTRQARGWAGLRRLRRAELSPLPAEWAERFATLCARCAPGLRMPRIGETALVRVPQVVGGGAAAILLPAGFLAGLSPAQAEAIVAHELAHLVRRDFWLNALQTLAEALFFFHPAVFAMSGHIRRERERACDDFAVERTGDALGYAKALATLAGAWPATPALAADGHEPGDLAARIGRVLGRPARRARGARLAPGGLLVFAAAMAVYAGLFAASPKIVAQVLTPEERVEVVREAVAETLPRQALTGGPRRYSDGEIKIISELRTEDGSPTPKTMWGNFATRNGDTGAGGSCGWFGGRAERSVRIGVVSLIAVHQDWAPVAIFGVAPEPGATEVVVPTMTLRKGVPLRVKLSDEGGNALVGVRVGVGVRPRGADSLSASYRDPLVSDAEGFIVLPHADPAFAYTFTAALPGRQGTVRMIENFTQEATVAWVLPLSRKIRGQVVEKGGGEPVAGASVWLAGASGTEAVYGQNFDEPPLATTDAEGRFELPGWDDAGTYALRFAHPAHANALVGARPGEELRVELERGGHRLSGRLRVRTDRAKSFMQPPRLSVTRWLSAGSSAWFAPDLVNCELKPEGDGVYRFEFERLPSGEVDFSAHGVSSRARLTLRGDRLDLELTMDDSRIEFAEGSPDALAAKAAEAALKEPESQGPKRTVEIVVKPGDGGLVQVFSMAYLVEPADLPKDYVSRYYKYENVKDGRVSLPDVPVKAKVTLSPMYAATGYWIPYSRFEVPEGEGTYRHEIPAYPAGAAVVDVRDADGLALAYDRLGLEGRDLFRSEDGAGRYSIEDSHIGGTKSRATLTTVPLGGRYRAVAQQGARVARSEWFTLNAARPRVDTTVRFAAGAPMLVRVRTADGKYVEGLRVALGYQSDEIDYVGTWSDTVSTGADGTGRFAEVTVDETVRYRLTVTPERDWQQQWIVVAATRPEEWVLTLKPGLKLSGRVVDGAGQPVSDAQVSAIVDVGDDWKKAAGVSPMAAEEPTDADGRFRLSNLIPGQLVIRVEQRMPPEGAEFPRLELTGDVAEELRIVVR